jgi:hypothetical protein
MRRTPVTLTLMASIWFWPQSAGGAPSSGAALSQPTQLATTWRTTPISTSSPTFHRVLGLGGRYCALGAVSLRLSASVTGAPASFEVLIDYGPTATPGVVTFAPTITSFTFLSSARPFEANDHHLYQIWWRSPTGRTTTLRFATFEALFQKRTKAC